MTSSTTKPKQPGIKKIPFLAIDTGTGLEHPDHKRFSVSYLPSWQRVRVKCSFKDREASLASIAMLNAYTGLASNEDLQYRVWRVFNLMNAVPIGQYIEGRQVIPDHCEEIVIPFRTQCSEKVKIIGLPTKWDWNDTRKEMKKEDFGWLETHYNTLRRTRANKARIGAKIELSFYMEMIIHTIYGAK